MDVVLAPIALVLAALGLYGWTCWYCRGDAGESKRIAGMAAAALLLRGFLHLTVIRHVSLFSHRRGGDCLFYERVGMAISRSWHTKGIRFVTAEEAPVVGAAALLENTLALIHYVFGTAPAPLGTVLLAMLACAATVLLYRLARDEGASARAALWMAAILLFSPSFVFYTSDVYKDGLVLFFTVASVTASLRMARDARLHHVLFIVASFAGLWFVRKYLVFACVGVPLVAFTVRRGNLGVRTLVGAAGVALALVVVARLFTGSVETAESLFEEGTSSFVMNKNATGGSGVTFRKGPWEFPLRLAYTLLSPFPWTSGSMGLHIGKLDALVAAVPLCLTLRSVGTLWRERKTLLLGLAAFVVPVTVVYALGISNMGLIVRQRMPIVACLACLAAVGASLRRRAGAGARPESGPRTG